MACDLRLQEQLLRQTGPRRKLVLVWSALRYLWCSWNPRNGQESRNIQEQQNQLLSAPWASWGRQDLLELSSILGELLHRTSGTRLDESYILMLNSSHVWSRLSIEKISLAFTCLLVSTSSSFSGPLRESWRVEGWVWLGPKRVRLPKVESLIIFGIPSIIIYLLRGYTFNPPINQPTVLESAMEFSVLTSTDQYSTTRHMDSPRSERGNTRPSGGTCDTLARWGGDVNYWCFMTFHDVSCSCSEVQFMIIHVTLKMAT